MIKLVYLTIIKYVNYVKLLKNTEIHLKQSAVRIERHQINRHLPPHLHMHQFRA